MMPSWGKAPGGAAIMAKTPKPQEDVGEQETEAERDLDEALEESFPASDPPAATRTSAGAPDHSATKQPQQASGGRGKGK
jgi:hypothetical protein